MMTVPRNGAPTPSPDQLQRLINVSSSDLSSGAKSVYTRLWNRCLNANSKSTMYLCSELADEIGVARKSISRNIAELRDAGMLETRDLGPNGLLFYIMGYCDDAAQLAFDIIESGNENVPNHVRLPLEAETKVLPIYSNSGGTLPPHPHPAREYYIAPSPLAENAPPPLDDDAMLVVQKLTQYGVTASVASDLVRRLPQRAERWSRAFRFVSASKLSNPGGWLRKAIELDYPLPKQFIAAEARPTETTAKKAPPVDPAIEAEIQRNAEIANRKLLESLPATVRYQLELEVDNKLEAPIFRAMKSDLRQSVRTNMIIEAAKLQITAGQGAVA